MARAKPKGELIMRKVLVEDQDGDCDAQVEMHRNHYKGMGYAVRVFPRTIKADGLGIEVKVIVVREELR